MQQHVGQGRKQHAADPGASLSIIVPAFNEREVLTVFHGRLSRVLDTLGMPAEVIYVDDGSTDDTITAIEDLRAADPRVTIIELSRNFGKEIALTAGLDHSRGDAAIIIDADLQDPPELIPELVRQWRAGYDVVYARRVSRDGETALKRLSAHVFYRLIQRVSRVAIPTDTGDYRLLSRRAVAAVKGLREQHRFMKGLFAWIGYPQKDVPYHRESRYAGRTKWSYWSLFNFAIEGITSFTIAPLKIATYLGLTTAAIATLYAGFIIYHTLVYGRDVAGYPSLLVTMLFLGAVQLITLGIIGEYLGRMFDESKRRPLYITQRYEPSRAASFVASDHPSDPV
jgi:glycosyltransferase involved in cell wall biosynthesis